MAFSFGTPAAAPASSTAPTFSFGTPAASAAPKTSLFGAPAASTSTPLATGGGGLFGSSSTTQQPTATGGSSLFSGGGGFGQPQQQQQPATSGGLFGQPQQQQQPATSGGLFGQPQQQQQPAFGQATTATGGGGLFGGASNQQQQPAASAGGLFGQPQQQLQQQQQQSQQQSQQQQPGGISGKTKFSDLPEAAQKVVEGIDAYIQQQVTLSGSLSQHPLSAAASSSSSASSYSDPSPSIPQTSRLLKRLLAETTALTNHLASSARSIEELRAHLTKDGEDAVRGARIMDASKTPQGRQSLRGQAKFPLEYFTQLTDSMEQRVQTYQRGMDQLHHHLTSLLPPSYASSGATSLHGSSTATPQTLSQTLQTHQLLLQRQAGQVAWLDEEVQALKSEWRVLWRERGGGAGSVRDVFGEGNEGLEVGGLRV